MILRLLLLMGLPLASFGCAAGRADMATPLDHPASPQAAEVPFTPPPNVLTDDPRTVPASTPPPTQDADRSGHTPTPSTEQSGHHH